MLDLSVKHPSTINLVLWRGAVTAPFLSEKFSVAPFDRAVVSWNGNGDAVCELEGCGGRLDVDTLILEEPAESFRIRVTPEANNTHAHQCFVCLAAATFWKHGEVPAYSEVRSEAWGKVLPVPERSQMIEGPHSSRICSPTSVAMVLEFHGYRFTTREVADGAYDFAHQIYGNWPLNTLNAHRLSGLPCYVRRGTGLHDLEAEIAAGRPVVIGHRWKEGELSGAPLRTSNGHLIVVVGFTESGDAVVNDPAGLPGAVRRVYRRRELQHTWLENASGIMYVIGDA